MQRQKWLTQADDMAYAEQIINKYIELNEGDPIGLFDVVVKANDTVDIRVADWIIELSDHYDQQYGSEQGSTITKLVVSQCLTQGETIH